MEEYKKQANAEFFKKIIEVTTEGGTYGYPATGEMYTVMNGCLYGTERGVQILKDITPKPFHSKIKLKIEA